MLQCPSCERQFKKQNDALSHYRTHHKELAMPVRFEFVEPPVEETKMARALPLFKCDKCSAAFHYAKALGKHRSAKHGILGMSKSSVLNRAHLAGQSLQPVNGVYTCPECKKPFKQAGALGSHRKRSHLIPGEQRKEVVEGFQCPECPRLFATQKGVNHHITRAHRDSNNTGIELNGHIPPAQIGATNGHVTPEHSQSHSNGHSQQAAVDYLIAHTTGQLEILITGIANRANLPARDFTKRVIEALYTTTMR